jgi:hypothetical protein
VTTVRRTLAVAAASALTALGPAAPASAEAVGAPGYCTDDTGVTVVVDFSALGGDVVVRCAPGTGGQGFTGLDALTQAGFAVAGTQRWGMEFVCRIQGRPTAHEDLAIPGDDSYHEDCGDTPPETAYWGYWYASNGGSWRYSSTSAASRSTIKGGFEGWSFHLGSGSAHPPPVSPRHAVEAATSSPPTRPGGQQHGGGTPNGSPTSSASSSGPMTSTSAATTDPGTGRPGSGGDRHASTRPPSATDASGPSVSTEPTGPTVTERADGPNVTAALPDRPDDVHGSVRPFLIGAGILALLGAGAGATAWRRSHRG